MKNYEVTLKLDGYLRVDIEADTSENAIKQAKSLLQDAITLDGVDDYVIDTVALSIDGKE